MDLRWSFIGLGVAFVIVAIWVYHIGAGLVGGGILVEGNSPAFGKGSAYEVLAYLLGLFGVLLAGAAAITFLRPSRS